MKTFIIAAISLDGFIARFKNDFSFDWTSKEDKKFFVEMTKKAGVVIFGSKTYETIGHPLKDRLNVVFSKKKKYDGVLNTSLDPQKLLLDLQKGGFKEAAICGGQSIYTLFMKKNLVDEIYLTVEPLIFGQGIGLFRKNLDTKLKLIDFRKLNDSGSILLHYKVLK
jgi:dihydrofolate reductase